MVTPFVQYPHYLYVKTCGKATQAANGDWVPGTAEWKFWSMCREETNGKGTLVTLADFKSYRFSSLIQLPVGTERIEEGSTVIASSRSLDTNGIDDNFLRYLYDENDGMIYDANGNLINTGSDVGHVRIIGKCAKFDTGRLHCRLWV